MKIELWRKGLGAMEMPQQYQRHHLPDEHSVINKIAGPLKQPALTLSPVVFSRCSGI